jgi:hypothetical protein
MRTAIARVNDGSFGAYRPTFQRVDKLHIKQIDVNRRFLSLPRAAAIDCLKYVAAAADCPTVAIVDKRRRREAN